MVPVAGRGRYDRSQTRADRAAQTRARIVDAALADLAQHPATFPCVARVTQGSGVGRATYYTLFPSSELLLRSVRSQARRRLHTALATATAAEATPLETLRAAAKAWCGWCAGEPDATRVVVLRFDSLEPRSAAIRLISAHLSRVARRAVQSGILPHTPDPRALQAVAAGWECLGILAGQESADWSELLVDLTVAALRAGSAPPMRALLAMPLLGGGFPESQARW